MEYEIPLAIQSEYLGVPFTRQTFLDDGIGGHGLSYLCPGGFANRATGRDALPQQATRVRWVASMYEACRAWSLAPLDT